MLILLAAAAAEYRAIGTEPFWSLVVGRRTIVLDRLGEPPLSVRTPRVRRIAGGRRYDTRTIRVTIVRRRCGDGMSDRVFPDTVTVVTRGQVLRGCGGLPPVERR